MNKALGQQIKRGAGFTLIEVLVAVAVTAMIAAISVAAFDSAEKAHVRTKIKLESIQRMDRAWLALEADLRNALSRATLSSSGDDTIPALKADSEQEEWLSLLRGGRANPLHFYRSELAYVAYSLEENVLVRKIWIDPANLEEELAYSQKLLEGVEEVQMRILPPKSRSIKHGPWLDEWPPAQAPEALPLALEITLVLEQGDEITRLFSLLPGL